MLTNFVDNLLLLMGFAYGLIMKEDTMSEELELEPFDESGNFQTITEHAES